MQDCQVAEVPSHMQAELKGSHLLAERRLESNEETILASPLGFQPGALRQGTQNDNQQEEEADHEWKCFGFVIVQNTYLEWKPKGWVQSFGPGQRPQSAGGCLEGKCIHM